MAGSFVGQSSHSRKPSNMRFILLDFFNSGLYILFLHICRSFQLFLSILKSFFLDSFYKVLIKSKAFLPPMYLQPGLAGINLGKFLIKRVITLVKKDMPHVSVSTLAILYDKFVTWKRLYLLAQQNCVLQTFATLSPIPGFMQWLLSKLSSQSRFAEDERGTQSNSPSSTFSEKVLLPEEEQAIMSLSE